MCSVCVFYTFFGGIKAVVHTDAWQIFVMFISVIVVTILGTIAAGGFDKVFETASNGGRIEFFKLVFLSTTENNLIVNHEFLKIVLIRPCMSDIQLGE